MGTAERAGIGRCASPWAGGVTFVGGCTAAHVSSVTCCNNPVDADDVDPWPVHCLPLAQYGSEVHVFVLEEEPIASKPMINKAQKNSKVRIHLGVEVLEAKGEEALKSVVVR